MGGQERGHMGVKAKRYKIIITILTMIIRMMIKWYNDVSAGCHKLPKDFKWQGQLSGLWWWWWCWVTRTKGIIIMLMMMVTMMVMLMMISCPQTSPTLSIQVWDWNSHSYHQYRLHHNPVSPFVQQSWTQHIMQGTMTQVTARCYPKIMIMIMILMMIATIIMTIITMTMMMEPQLSPTLLGIAHLRWGELNDFQPKANCEDPGMPILIVKIPRPRTPHPICWWIQWRSQWGTHRGTITSTIFVWFICVFHIRYVSSTSGSLMSLLRFDNFSCQCFSLHMKWLCWHNSWVETCSHKTCAICLSSGEAKALVCSRCRQEMGAVGVVGATIPPPSSSNPPSPPSSNSTSRPNEDKIAGSVATRL